MVRDGISLRKKQNFMDQHPQNESESEEFETTSFMSTSHSLCV